MNEDSEVLHRIFKLFCLFYEKFSNPPIDELRSSNAPNNEEIISNVETFYSSQKIKDFISVLNDVLRIVLNANIEITETISNLIFCAFGSFIPDVQKQLNTIIPEASNTKRTVKMTSIDASLVH